MQWTYDAARSAFVHDGVSVADTSQAEPGVRYEWQRRGRCGDDIESCPAAASTCRRGSERGYRYLVFGFELTSAGEHRHRFADVVSTECVYPEKVVPASDVQAVAAQHIRRHLGRPAITVAPPGGRTLVNIPTIYSTADLDPVTLPIVAPVPGRITATPSYTWRFPNGQTASGPGTPYDESFSPSAHADHYVHTVYEAAGAKRTTLTVTWRVSFQLQDVLDVPLAPITFTAANTTRALTARNVLIDGPRQKP
jgi:hypothetical protein